MAHCTYPVLHENHVRREAGKAFTDMVEEPNIKIHLHLGGEKIVNKALRQALKLQAVFLAARSQKRVGHSGRASLTQTRIKDQRQ